MTNVVEFDGVTKLDIPTERILTGALEEELETAIVIGYDQDGGFYFSSSAASGPEVLWLLEIARTRLVDTAEGICDP